MINVSFPKTKWKSPGGGQNCYKVLKFLQYPFLTKSSKKAHFNQNVSTKYYLVPKFFKLFPSFQMTKGVRVPQVLPFLKASLTSVSPY